MKDARAAADPDGQIAADIGDERVIGAVVYPASELIAPGVVKVFEGNRFTLGEPDGSKSERIQRLSEALTEAGFKAPDRARYPRRDLAQALGQRDIQSDQRADPRHAR